MSGIGKGVIAASIGRILQARGLRVTAVKIDPYLNYDAGTITAGSLWQPSAKLPSNAPYYSGAVAYQVRLTPVGTGAAFTLDDLYLDPYVSK